MRFPLTCRLACLTLAVLGALASFRCGASAGPEGDYDRPSRRRFTYDTPRGRFSVAYLDTGDISARPIVLIHGFGNSVYTWHSMLPVLAEEHRVVAIDLLGCGHSEKPEGGDYSLEAQARMIVALLEDLDLKDLALVGHSMGGTAALFVAAESGTRDYTIARLVLIDAPAFKQPLPWFIRVLSMPIVGPLSLRVVPRNMAVKSVLKHAYYDDSLISTDEIDAYARALATPGGRKALVETARELTNANKWGTTIDYGEIDIPVTIIWGDHDHVVPFWVAERLATVLPKADPVVRIDRCGHVPPTEKPDSVLKVILTSHAHSWQSPPPRDEPVSTSSLSP